MYIFPKEFFSNRIFVQGFANLRNFFQRKVFPIIFFPKEVFFQKSGEIKNFFPTTFSPAEIISKGIFSDRNSFQRYKSPKIGNFFQKFLFKCEFFSKEKPYMGTLFQALSLEQLTV